MPKPADIEPRWLVSLMCVWVIHVRAADNGHLGYPNKVAWLSLPSSGSGHADPTGFCAQDFVELETALEQLKNEHEGQYMAMMLYYRPWAIRAAVEAGWPFGNSTYYERLHAAHRKVAASIDRLRVAA